MKRKDIPLNEHFRALLQTEPPLAQPGLPGWLAEERNVCREWVCTHGFPGQGREPWKYTDVSGIQNLEWELPRHAPRDPAPLPASGDTPVVHLTLRNGSYVPMETEDCPTSISLRPLADPAHLDCIKPVLQRTNYRQESIFSVLNRALWHDGLCVRIAPEAQVKLHLHLIYGGAGSKPVLAAPRVYIKAGHHCEAEITVSQWNCDTHPSMGTACLDIDLAAGAKVVYLHDQQLHADAFTFTTTRIALARDATLHALDVARGGQLARHDLSVSLQESGSTTTLNGIYLLRNHQTADFHTTIEHRQPHASSRQVYKGVLDDHAHAIFNGLVEVHPGAMGTDGYQLNRTLLRSPHACIDTKPELQIHNDDVRCSHGATIGQLDPLELFYLQSRAIPTAMARDMLARAFVVDLIHQQPSPYQQERIQQAVMAFFDKPT